ncbi:CobW family GTP-binding protein [Salininema proteolyticum]|uniref:CobW family GTP-binding protein n=1 Tax=Salininema proteolyticum TaxID=1607685 RepID=A0ABV8TSJ5_9ACTN
MSRLTRPDPSSPATPDLRARLTIVSGFHPRTTASLTASLLRADRDVIAVSYDIGQILTTGSIRRTVRTADKLLESRTTILEHACLSCAVREDVVPTLARIAERRPGGSVVLQLPPALEPDTVADACQWHTVEDRPVTELLAVDSVIAAVDPETVLDELDSDDDLAHRDMQAADNDTRSVSEVVARQVEHADTVLTWAPGRPESYEDARLSVLLHRINPWSRRLTVRENHPGVLAEVLLDAGNFNPDHPPIYGRGLEGYGFGVHEPESDCGVVSFVFRSRRPFHPGRLNATLPVLADNSIRARGQLWLATQPEKAIAFHCCGGGVSMGPLTMWLEKSAPEDWEETAPARQVYAGLNWDEVYGERENQIAVIGMDMDSEAVRMALEACLVREGEETASLPDPFAGCFDEG